MTKIIQLTKGFCALVDDEDFERLSRNRWYTSGRKGYEYAARRSKDHEETPRALVYMHREVLGVQFKEGFNSVDHINGNRLDNRKENLRLVSHARNMQNSSTARDQTGVGYDSTHNRFKAYVNVPTDIGTKRINVGTFRTREEAITARERFIIREGLAV